MVNVFLNAIRRSRLSAQAVGIPTNYPRIGVGTPSLSIMEFLIDKSQKNIYSLMREIGYCPAPLFSKEKNNFIRRIDKGDFPRFHLYVKIEKSSEKIILNLHLDQKKPRYKGTTAHNAEYEGKIVEEEAERIRTLLR